MKRTGRVLFIFLIILGCMAGLWLFQSWKDTKNLSDKKTIRNGYITEISGSSVNVVSDGKQQVWESASAITGQAVTGVADLYLQDKKIVRVVKKPETVQGKILKISDDVITLEGYGNVKLDSEFVVYRVAKNGTVSAGSRTDIAVGNTDTRFVAAGSRLCAAVMPETQMETIRVLLSNNDFSSYQMEKTVLTATTDYTVKIGKEVSQYKKGQKATFEPGSLSGRALVSTGGRGKIRIETLKRQYGVPEYRGTIEIEKNGNYLNLVNELPLEEYLYSVVPSEMPTEYEPEALKAQAVCARSYAAEHMRGNRMAKYGAHVDDSVSYQVYNNLKEDGRSIAAVNTTKNQVVAYQGKIATTYFYSASCGSTAGTKDVWFTKKEVPYLPSSLQTIPRTTSNLKTEEAFQDYIRKTPDTVDSTSPWYRWQTVIPQKEIEKTISASIQRRYQANPTQIQVKEKDGTYKSRPVTDIGHVKNIEVKSRGAGGVVSMIEIQGTKETLHVYTEYNIRTLLIGRSTVFTRKDKKKVTGLNILPSGFFYVKKKGNSYALYGGGYGHGVGMSQNGANTLATRKKNYQEILTFYFPGTSVQSRESL
ncbi:MAG: SpoIID/LytB domain-containing protein [Lachnospiraceae bacterium]|nr:SpoIID/LytB domain-containing protein [Lachnospiraceae bacterium]